jgi:hypothetical protein
MNQRSAQPLPTANEQVTPCGRASRHPQVSHWIETTTGWSIKKFVRTTRRYRTIQIRAGPHSITAADPLPDDLRDTPEKINNARSRAH